MENLAKIKEKLEVKKSTFNNYLVTDYLEERSFLLDVDGLIINSKEFSTYPGNTFTYKEIATIIKEIRENKNITKKIILNCDRIIDEKELTQFKDFICKFLNKVDYFIYSDYSCLTMVEEKDYDKFIYDPKTLVCSYEEANVLPTKSFISSELSYEEIEKIFNNSKDICLNAFGFHRIMYSKRPLLSLYNEFHQTDVLSKDKLYDLKEEIRDEHYKVLENEYGTYIYSPYVYAFTKTTLSKAFIVRIDSFNLDYDFLVYIINEYRKLLVNSEDISYDILKKINEYIKEKNIDLVISEEFLKEKLFLLKDDDNK